MSPQARIFTGRGAASGRSLASRRRPPVSRWRAVLRWSAATAIAAAVGWTVFWMLTAPFFSLSEVRTGPYRFTDRAALEGAMRTVIGGNIWRTDIGGLEDRLEQLPWVRSASAARRLPGALKVSFVEWRPVLVLPSRDGEPRVMIENGEALRLPAGMPAPDLPVLVDRRDGGDFDSETAGRLIALIAAVAETGLETICPVDFLLLDDEGLQLVLQQERGRLILGRDSFGRRLRRYLAVSDRVGDGRVVDLRFDGTVCVRDGAA